MPHPPSAARPSWRSVPPLASRSSTPVITPSRRAPPRGSPRRPQHRRGRVHQSPRNPRRPPSCSTRRCWNLPCWTESRGRRSSSLGRASAPTSSRHAAAAACSRDSRPRTSACRTLAAATGRCSTSSRRASAAPPSCRRHPRPSRRLRPRRTHSATTCWSSICRRPRRPLAPRGRRCTTCRCWWTRRARRTRQRPTRRRRSSSCRCWSMGRATSPPSMTAVPLAATCS